MQLNWGICATGRIANDFCVALGTLSDIEHRTVAVAARRLEDAQSFATQHNIPLAYGGYEALALDPEVHVVYVATVNTQHYEVARCMLEHGKHVLVEKPMCMNQQKARRLIMYAERKRLLLVEGLWSRSFPVYEFVRRLIRLGLLGDVVSVRAEMGFDLRQVDRVQ